MIKKIMQTINTGHLIIEITKEHIEMVNREIKKINDRRIRIFSVFTLVLELSLIIFNDLAAMRGIRHIYIGRINTSEMYFLIHSLIAISAIVVFILNEKFPQNTNKKFYNYYIEIEVFVMMMLISLIGFLDQFTIGNVTSYVSVLLICGSVALIKPPLNYIIYTIAHLFFVGILVMNFENSAVLMGNLINSSIFYLAVLFISKFLYENQVSHLAKNIVLEEINKKMEYLSNYDKLTGLPNRRYFEELMKKDMLDFKGNSVIAMMDVDFFKKINDKYGHHVGDKALKDISRIIIDTTGPNNLVARWGGEEFIFFLPEMSVEEAEIFLNKIRINIEKHRIISGNNEIKVTASFGFTRFIGETEDEFNECFRLADEALYFAKENGRNKVVKKEY